MRLGSDCPPEFEEVGTEVILHSEYSWTQIAERLGVTRGQAVYRFRRLLAAAGVAGVEATSRHFSGGTQMSRSCISSTCLSMTSRRYSACPYGTRSR